MPDSSNLYDFTVSSLSSTIASSNVINYNRIFGQKATPESIVTANHADYGFYVSDSAINMGDYGIDTSRIPDNYIINYGDTVYNYTITNPSTGKSDTINNYITNNYIISGDDQGSSGGDTINNWNISFGDFLIDIGNTIQTSITAVFVPSDVVLENYQTKLTDTINLKLPFINDIGTILDSLFVDIRDGNIIYSSNVSTYAASDDGSSADDEDEDDSPPPDLVDGNSDLYIYPKWKINLSFFGQDMELTILDFSMYADVLFYVRIVVAAFVYIAYFVNIYRYLPVLIGGVGDMTNTVLTLSSRSSKKGDDD